MGDSGKAVPGSAGRGLAAAFLQTQGGSEGALRGQSGLKVAIGDGVTVVGICVGRSCVVGESPGA